MDKRAIVWVDTVLMPWVEAFGSPWSVCDRKVAILRYYKTANNYLKISKGKLFSSPEEFCEFNLDEG
jgi:hypothetical protein